MLAPNIPATRAHASYAAYNTTDSRSHAAVISVKKVDINVSEVLVHLFELGHIEVE